MIGRRGCSAVKRHEPGSGAARGETDRRDIRKLGGRRCATSASMSAENEESDKKCDECDQAADDSARDSTDVR